MMTPEEQVCGPPAARCMGVVGRLAVALLLVGWPTAALGVDQADPMGKRAQVRKAGPAQAVQAKGTEAVKPPRRPKSLVPKLPQRNIRTVLAQTEISVDYNDLALDDAIANLRAQLGINILVHWPALEQVGLYPDEPVTLQLKNVSARRVLELVLRNVGNAAPSRLGWQVSGGVLEIKPRKDLRQRRILRVYYAADLWSRASRGYLEQMGLRQRGPSQRDNSYQRTPQRRPTPTRPRPQRKKGKTVVMGR